MFAKVLLGYSGRLLGSCYAVAEVLLDSVFWVITDIPTSDNNRKLENQTLFSKLIQFQCFDIIVFLSDVRKLKSVALKLALKRDLYHLSSLCNINRTACL